MAANYDFDPEDGEDEQLKLRAKAPLPAPHPTWGPWEPTPEEAHFSKEKTNFDPKEVPFEQRWENTRPLGPAETTGELLESQERAKEGAPFAPPMTSTPASSAWEDIRKRGQSMGGDITDERGETLPQLNLKAQYLRREGAYGDYTLPPGQTDASWRHKDLPDRPLYPGITDFPRSKAWYDHRLYMIDKDIRGETSPHNTPLDNSQDFANYLKWARTGGKNPFDEEHDYDLRGYYKAGGQLGPPDRPSHLPDQFKKPNHPTFSEESRYSGSAGELGGKWIQNNRGEYVGFRPGPSNLRYWTPEALQAYFSRYEPGVKIHWPPLTEAIPTSPEEQRQASAAPKAGAK